MKTKVKFLLFSPTCTADWRLLAAYIPTLLSQKLLYITNKNLHLEEGTVWWTTNQSRWNQIHSLLKCHIKRPRLIYLYPIIIQRSQKKTRGKFKVYSTKTYPLKQQFSVNVYHLLATETGSRIQRMVELLTSLYKIVKFMVQFLTIIWYKRWFRIV